MKLYGTVTSPFVRRVRMVADELGVPVESIDTAGPEGQAALRAVSPIAKVPTAVLDGAVVFDSRAIIDLLLDAHGPGPLRATTAATRVDEWNLLNAVDAALEAAIRLFYLRRDGIDPAGIPYMVKEQDRVRAVMTWIDGHLHGPWCTGEAGFGRAELALLTTADWMRFRQAYDVDAHPNIVALAAAHAERPSAVRTRPAAT